jgi:hypothetical protein
MKRSTMTKLIEMQIKSDGLIQRSPVESTQRFAERVLQAVLKAGMQPPIIKKDEDGDLTYCEFEPE